MAKDNSGKTVVRRVKASDSSSATARTDDKKAVKKLTAKSAGSAKSTKKPVDKPVKKPAAAPKAEKSTFILFRPIFAIGRYFRDSWRELRQVRWTNRRATWALTLAVILFCVFFAALIMLFDWVFNWLIQEVIL